MSVADAGNSSYRPYLMFAKALADGEIKPLPSASGSGGSGVKPPSGDAVEWMQGSEVLNELPPGLQDKVRNCDNLSNEELAVLLGEVIGFLMDSGALDMSLGELSELFFGDGAEAAFFYFPGASKEQSMLMGAIATLIAAKNFGELSSDQEAIVDLNLTILTNPDASAFEKAKALDTIVNQVLINIVPLDAQNNPDFKALLKYCELFLLTVFQATTTHDPFDNEEYTASLGGDPSNLGKVFEDFGFETTKAEKDFLSSEMGVREKQIFLLEQIVHSLPDGHPDKASYQKMLADLKASDTALTEGDFGQVIDSFVDDMNLDSLDLTDGTDEIFNEVDTRTYSDWGEMSADCDLKIQERKVLLEFLLSNASPLKTPEEIQERINSDPVIRYYTEKKAHAERAMATIESQNPLNSTDPNNTLDGLSAIYEFLMAELKLASAFTSHAHKLGSEIGASDSAQVNLLKWSEFFDKLIAKISTDVNDMARG